MTKQLRNFLIIALSAICLFVSAAFLSTANFAVNADEKPTEITYVEKGAQWKYVNGYVNNFPTIDLTGSLVTSNGFAVSNAPFGFAEYGQYDFTDGTVVDKTYRQYIFTKTFNVTEVSTALRFDLEYDDGIAIYLNGKEVYRENIVGINFDVVEDANIVDVTVGKADKITFNLLSDFLVEGQNVITVYLLQDFAGGQDAYFDMALTGVSDFEVALDDMPDTVSQTYYDDPYTSRGITFFTGISLRLGEVRYRAKGSQEWNYAQTEGVLWYGRAGHKATIKDLSEGTTYEYAVGSLALDVWSKTFEFSTKVKAETEQGFKFSYFTDTQSSDAWQFSIWNKLYEYMKADEDYDYDFHVHGGDIVESSVNEKTLVPEQWRQGFNVMQEFLTSEVMMPVAGNHEYSAFAFASHFNVKWANFSNCGAYYSFDYGNAHFTVMDTNESILKAQTFKTEQKEWIENDLASTDKEWKIAIMHFPAIDNTQPAHIQLTREVLMPLFAKYKVDLVLSGHTHQYFRSTVYAHDENLAGASQAETLTNIKNSAINEEDLVTYTDLSDGTIYTVNPKGVMYVTAKTTNYNVLYQNFIYQQAHESVVFATNPITGKVMNGGSADDDTSYLMRKLQYVSVEVGTDTLKCNVYNYDYDTGEKVLYDTYCVNKADSEKLNSLIENLPQSDQVDKDDMATLVNVYGLYGALGDEGILDGNKTKIASLLSAIPEQVAADVLNLNRKISVLEETDLEGYTACSNAYQSIPETNKGLVDVTKLNYIANKVAADEVKAKIEKVSALSTIALTEQDVTELENAFNALNDDQKARVSNAEKITDLKAKIKAKVVIEKINQLKIAPTKTMADEVYAEYNALSAQEKIHVENFDVLDAIRKAYASVQTGGGCSGSIGALECGTFAVSLIIVGAVLIAVRKKKGDRV